MRHKYRHTNHHAAASLSFKVVPAAPLGVAHDTNATWPTARITAPPCPSHTRCTRGTGRAGTYEAGFVFRVVVVASSSARPVGCSGITRNTATTLKRSASPRNAANSDLKSSASGLFRTCLVAFFHCDAAAGRPGGREHFSCLGCSSTTLGWALNRKSRGRGSHPLSRLDERLDKAVAAASTSTMTSPSLGCALTAPGGNFTSAPGTGGAFMGPRSGTSPRAAPRKSESRPGPHEHAVKFSAPRRKAHQTSTPTRPGPRFGGSPLDSTPGPRFGGVVATAMDRNGWKLKPAMKLLIYSKRLQYDRFEQIRTLRPNAAIPWSEIVPTSESEPYIKSGCVARLPCEVNFDPIHQRRARLQTPPLHLRLTITHPLVFAYFSFILARTLAHWLFCFHPRSHSGSLALSHKEEAARAPCHTHAWDL